MKSIIDEGQCPYFDNKKACTKYRYVSECSTETCEKSIENGWRRFGKLFFMPMCQDCTACKSVRIVVADFKPSRSMRRTWQKNQDIKIKMTRPKLSQEHLSLYKAYHQFMHYKKAWKKERANFTDYFNAFINGYHNFGYEFSYYLEEKLVAVALFDLTGQSLSAVYCYYDPNLRHRGLGTFSILNQVFYAKSQNIPFVYLGYWIKDNLSLNYKANFSPLEVLDKPLEMDKIARWNAFDTTYSK